MKLLPKADTYESETFTGFHNAQALFPKDKPHPFLMSLQGKEHGINEGFIAPTRKIFPVYKSFFPIKLSKEEIIQQLIESLSNIDEQEKQPANRTRIDGIAKNGARIRTIIDKTGNIITFFPVAQKPKEEIKAETQELQTQFVKFFFNPEKKPLRKPITDKEVAELLQQFNPNIPFNMVVGRVDTRAFTTSESNKQLARLGIKLRPFYKNVLIETNKLDALLKNYPNDFIIESAINTLHLTPKILLKVFSEKNDPQFPPYLTRLEILNLLKKSLAHIEHSSLWSSFSATNGCFFGSEEEIEDVVYNLPTFRRDKNLLHVKGFARGKLNPLYRGKEVKESFWFFIIIDEDTGNITNFYPLFK